MTGFAETLIARSRGIAPAIQPLAPSRFEPASGSGMEITEEMLSAPPARPAPSAAPLPRELEVKTPQPRQEAVAPQVVIHSHGPEVERVETREIRSHLTEREPVRETRWAEPPPPELAHETRREEPPRPAPLRIETRVQSEAVSPPSPRPLREVETRLIPDRERDQPPPPPIRPIRPIRPSATPRAIEPLIIHETRLVASPAPSPLHHRLKPVPPIKQPTPPPEIQVTIGRIEIRSAAPATPPARRSAPVGVTLEEYARRRKQGDSR